MYRLIDEDRACEECASVFHVRFENTRFPIRFCSHQCSLRATGGSLGVARNGEERQCEICGQPFFAVPSEDKSKSGPRRFCSKACFYKGRKPRLFARRRTHTAGYIQLWMPGHPRASDGYVFEHILVAEAKLGRPIGRDEEVHHRNRIRADNRPENLIVLSPSEHAKLHAAENKAAKEK